MYAVGVGKAVEEELNEIASDPVNKHSFYSADFTTINLIAEDLKLNVCPGMKRPFLFKLKFRFLQYWHAWSCFSCVAWKI